MRSYPNVRCPTCKQYGDWFSGKYGPFCSHRCQLIDLGKWLNEDYRISEPLRPEHLEAYEEMPPGSSADETGQDEE